MSYFEGLTDGLFKKDAAGNTVFYPYGILGPGYIIKSKEKAEEIRSYVIFANMIGFGGAIFIRAYHSTKALLLFVLVFGVSYVLFVYLVTNDLEKSPDRLTFNEALKNSAKSHGPLTLWFFSVGSICFVIMGILLLPKNMLLGATCIVLFGFCAITFILMLLSLYK